MICLSCHACISCVKRFYLFSPLGQTRAFMWFKCQYCFRIVSHIFKCCWQHRGDAYTMLISFLLWNWWGNPSHLIESICPNFLSHCFIVLGSINPPLILGLQWKVLWVICLLFNCEIGVLKFGNKSVPILFLRCVTVACYFLKYEIAFL